MNKDRTIWCFLAALADVTDSGEWAAVDHWEGDLAAIGIARADSRQPLVYISTHNQPQGHYWYECELPPSLGTEAPYITGRNGRADFQALLQVLREHLGIKVRTNRE